MYLYGNYIDIRSSPSFYGVRKLLISENLK